MLDDAGPDRITLGDVTVTRVVEYHGSVDLSPAQFFPDGSAAAWEAHRDELVPDFWRPEIDDTVAAVQTWVVRSAGRTVLVDTGVGNHKDHPHAPVWHHRNGDFLEALAAAGTRPEDVDVVVNTHVHGDHVGWNTRLDGGEWVPTFPNATYLIPGPDLAFWDPANEHAAAHSHRSIFTESVAPVRDAGLVAAWEDAHRIDENLTLEPAPGHTPGSSVLVCASRGERALFVGDLVHSPFQLAEPDVDSCFCVDPAESRRTRRRLLARAADERALFVPAHFPGHGAAEVARDGSRFVVRDWAGFSRLSPPGGDAQARAASQSSSQMRSR